MPIRDDRAKTFVLTGVLTALALGLSLIDQSVSAFLAFLPGFKLGLANLVSLFALYYLGFSWALLICVVRCLLTAMFSGQLTMFFFSIGGGILSLVVMQLAKDKLSIIKVSMLGGVVHNMAQLVIAGLVTATADILSYLPVLIVLGTLTGFALGLVSVLIFRRLPRSWKLLSDLSP